MYSLPNIYKAVLIFALIVAAQCYGAPSAPVVGSFGFDWLQPNTARCAAVTEKTLKALPPCEYNPDGTFGLRDPAFQCRRNKRSEYLVYESNAACLRNLETMKANAP